MTDEKNDQEETQWGTEDDTLSQKVSKKLPPPEPRRKAERSGRRL